MDTTTKTILIVAVVGILAKLILGGKADRNVDIPGLINEGALVIDTRTAGEFSQGHIKGALNIPYNAIAEKIGPHTKDKSKQIIVYCHSGARSGAAKRSLVSAGYTNVVNGGSLHRMRKQLTQ
ncbi:MAG: rhodanese-like domain-containing protein [Deltaproteobacteria bacterium]|nr:rhodanese-like domain-containing protein [Deltaproteobacteria bacterium]